MQLQHQEIEEETSSTRSVQSTDGQPTEAGLEKSETLRVTPEEVALAVAALEAKRENASAHREATLPLEEAIQHLGLNASPKELAEEVISLRTARDAKIKLGAVQKQILRGTWLAVTVFVFVIGCFIMLVLSTSIRRAQRTLHPMAVLPIQKLSSIPDNTPVHIDSDTLAALAKGAVTPENVSVDTRAENSDMTQSATMFNNEWTVVKLDGVFQVRGWATAELALNISNDSTGGIFSSRPTWLPANNLVPIQVPVYRLEGQPFGRYAADSKATNTAANSVLVTANVTNIGTAAKDIVRADILQSNEDFNYIGAGPTGSRGLSYYEVDIKSNVVHITGDATTYQLKKQASDVAVATLQRLHIPYTVSNELKIETNNE